MSGFQRTGDNINLMGYAGITVSGFAAEGQVQHAWFFTGRETM